MAKRSRGSNRPGQRRSTRARYAPPRAEPSRSAEATRPSTGLTDAEEQRAAEIEAGIVEQEREADAARRRNRDRGRTAIAEPDLALRGRPRGSLAVRFADEYAYVSRDLRRIGLLAVVLLAILFSVFFLVEVAAVIKV